MLFPWNIIGESVLNSAYASISTKKDRIEEAPQTFLGGQFHQLFFGSATGLCI